MTICNDKLQRFRVKIPNEFVNSREIELHFTTIANDPQTKTNANATSRVILERAKFSYPLSLSLFFSSILFPI